MKTEDQNALVTIAAIVFVVVVLVFTILYMQFNQPHQTGTKVSHSTMFVDETTELQHNLLSQGIEALFVEVHK